MDKQCNEVNKPKIFVFSNVIGGGDGMCYAIAEDGTVLANHWCSNESYAKYDLGFVQGSRPELHTEYAEHYPEGYEMVFVPHEEVGTHDGLNRAVMLHNS